MILLGKEKEFPPNQKRKMFGLKDTNLSTRWTGDIQKIFHSMYVCMRVWGLVSRCKIHTQTLSDMSWYISRKKSGYVEREWERERERDVYNWGRLSLFMVPQFLWKIPISPPRLRHFVRSLQTWHNDFLVSRKKRPCINNWRARRYYCKEG